ncbi:E3 ubiquitin-protein ligase TRIM17-like [Sinocyclocheilus rhinocerous]|uniref:E3 ubiquitin-protein ligase TRIM17-like n=1 Tax=Sinocyclocheilus rhinocerous TaxID=307959 RepID=UPI0007B82605|nr:PREDICTED: E3 ubiquitin-protein ligase TRIM17-like [Sinocyclocheilus rhinocerous]
MIYPQRTCRKTIYLWKIPVRLSCSQSIFKECLQQFWKTRNTQECPVCRRRSSRNEPPCNLVLKNSCESLTVESASGSEEVCSLHNEKLKLFCLDDEQPVCVVCRDSEKHVSHRFRPINEVVPSYKEGLKTAMKTLQEKLEYTKEIKVECDKKVHQIKSQSQLSERQIREEFNKLNHFLQIEEKATITALRKEEEQMSQMMKEKLEHMNRQILTQAEHTERQIKEEFKKIHQFLRDEEEASITELRKEEEQKSQKMKEKLEELL